MSRIDDDIKKGTFSHCYLLYGPEAYLRDNDCVKIRRVLTSEEDTMNWSRYEGKDLPLREVISQAETMPFFAERRLIEIRGSGLFKGAKETSDTKALLELLKGVGKHFTIPVFITQHINSFFDKTAIKASPIL